MSILPAAAKQPQLQARVAGESWPVAVYVTGPGEPYGAAAGLADPAAGRPLTVDTPLRIASNTKTFVAATVLRLWEQRRIDLDAPIAPLLTPALDAILRADGYATDRITVRHLLSHSGGLYDHGGDPRYIEAVLADPSHVWTREELVRLATTYADPPSAPGTEFRYSDTGYILLGDIIERITGKNLAAAVREQLRLDRLGLAATWWERFEAAPAGAMRARQFLGARDATDIDPSMDLYGGGGLLMSARDLATFFAALFEGRVFDRPETLREMLWHGPHRGARMYRLGIFVRQIGDREVYWHTGFWGTAAAYSPATRIAAAAVSTNQDAYPRLQALVQQVAAGQAPAAPAPR
ncbi:MAG TPA: serine hydrolase domain-containing protein [Allosphingosinicella sp.]